MKSLNDDRMNVALAGCVIALFALNPITIQAQDGRPTADAGSARYAAQDPVVLDGTGSSNPDSSGPLSYSWQQISGPNTVISDANTATPTVSGFVQTDEIQECKFELVVGDGELTSLPDVVEVVIVPAFVKSGDSAWTNAKNEMLLENDFFDPNKPTIVFFNGATGGPPYIKGGTPWTKDVVQWKEMANVISFFPYVLDPESIPPTGPRYGDPSMTCSRPADMIIAYLSAVAPDYHQGIQTLGQSMGGVPAIDVALRLNKVYADARYAVNRVSFLDATGTFLGGDEYSARVADFLANPVDGEQCWLDRYHSSTGGPTYLNALHIVFSHDATVTNPHGQARNWYRTSLVNEYANQFNSGVVAGAYWSVAGPGRNLQLASTPDTYVYEFIWSGGENYGHMSVANELRRPGRLPEPVTLVGPVPADDSNGVLLTCEESENAVGYQLLVGTDPYRIMDYTVISDAPAPPNDVVTTLPFEEGWWTVKARDQYGSTIYADPIHICVFAHEPSPADGAVHPATWVPFSWKAGIATPSYDVYLGESFASVNDGAPETFQGNQAANNFAVGFPGLAYPTGLVPGTTYFWRVDDVSADGTILHKGEVWSFTVSP